MNKFACLLAVPLALQFLELQSLGQQSSLPDTPAYGSPFQALKTYQEQAAALGGSKAQQNEIHRNILRARYGDTGLEKMFQGYAPSPSIEGIGKTIRLAASDSPNQAKGYKRTLLYEKEFTKGGKFKVLKTDKIINTRFGDTDVDLWLKQQSSGKNVLVEVKDNKFKNQNISEYKLKIQRLADYAERHGTRAALVNRYTLKPEIKEFARKNGVFVYDDVATGKLSGQKPGNMPFREMESDLSQRLTRISNAEAIRGGFSAGVGVLLLYTSTRELVRLSHSDSDDIGVGLKTGEQGSLLVAGGGFTASGLAQVGSRFVTAGSTLAKLPLGSITKWGGRLGFAGLLAAEGFSIAAYRSGAINERQFYTQQAKLGGGFAGGWAGAEAGGLIGVAVVGGPENPLALITAPLGALIGGVVGSLGGATAGNMVASSIYANLDEAQKIEVRNFIYRQYGVSQ